MNLKNNPKLFSLSPPVQAGKAHPDFCGTNRLRELLILWMGCLIKLQLPPAFCQVNQTVHPFLVTLLLGEIIGAEGRAFLRPRKVSDDLGRGLPGVWHYFIISARPVPDLSPTCVAQGFILSQAWYFLAGEETLVLRRKWWGPTYRPQKLSHPACQLLGLHG